MLLRCFEWNRNRSGPQVALLKPLSLTPNFSWVWRLRTAWQSLRRFPLAVALDLPGIMRTRRRKTVKNGWCACRPLPTQLKLAYVFSVAQICNLPYRRIAFCGQVGKCECARTLGRLCRLQIGDTADYKSALRGRAGR